MLFINCNEGTQRRAELGVGTILVFPVAVFINVDDPAAAAGVLALSPDAMKTIEITGLEQLRRRHRLSIAPNPADPALHAELAGNAITPLRKE